MANYEAKVNDEIESKAGGSGSGGSGGSGSCRSGSGGSRSGGGSSANITTRTSVIEHAETLSSSKTKKKKFNTLGSKRR
jgi:hypothetical protein